MKLTERSWFGLLELPERHRETFDRLCGPSQHSESMKNMKSPEGAAGSAIVDVLFVGPKNLFESNTKLLPA